jgi:hypothetical protein
MKKSLIWASVQILSVSIIAGGLITTLTHGMGY